LISTRLKLLLASSVAIVLTGAVALSMSSPYRRFSAETFVEMDRGVGTAGIARSLQQAGVIRYTWQFWLLRVLRPSARLQAGEYRFNRPATVSEVFSRIARGDVYYFEFTVPEGSNMFDIAHGLEAAGIMQAADFLRAAAEPSLIRDLAPQARTLEGYLFPATYRLSHATTAAGLCRRMTDQFRRQWKMVAGGRAADVHRTVTLASLVEKETALPAERPLVAGVFVNRLKDGMRLECDPTTIYAALLDDRYRGMIHRSDLASSNPYNTYQNAGLPPGPIANPGADSIAAALQPAETDYLYFVAKPGGGGHQFSASLAQHQRAVQAYRRGSQVHDTGNRSKNPGKKG
jgi:UPF0755 protein